MGIRGFYSYIQEFADAALVWHKLQNCQLVIDGNNLAYEICGNSPGMNTAFGGDYDKYAMHIERFFSKLSECKVEPIVVMDGGYPMQRNKFNTAYSRLTDQIETCKIMNPDKQDSLKVFPLMARSVFIFTLHKIGVKVLQADFEADDEIVVVAKKLGAYVLSNDSDFYIFDVPFILLNSVNMKHVQKEEGSKGGCANKFIPCYRFDVQRFCKITRVRKELIPLLAPILGNDYINPKCMIPFYISIFDLRPTSKKISGRKKIIISVIKWLSTQEGSPEEVLEKIVNFGYSTREFSDKLQKGLRRAFQMYFPSSSYLEPWLSSNHEKSCYLKSENYSHAHMKNLEHRYLESQSLVELLACTCNSKTNCTILSYGNLPDWIIRSFRLGLVPHIIADFLTKDYFFAIPQIEACERQCPYVTFQNLIKDLRGLLWVTYARGSENLNSETLNTNFICSDFNVKSKSKKKRKKRTSKKACKFVEQNTNIDETEVGIISGNEIENGNDNSEDSLDKNEDETSLSVKKSTYTAAALPCEEHSFNNENDQNLETGLEENFCKSLTIKNASVIDDNEVKLACKEINLAEGRCSSSSSDLDSSCKEIKVVGDPCSSNDVDSKSECSKKTESMCEPSTVSKGDDPIASLIMNYYDPSKNGYSAYELRKRKLFTSTSSKSDNECVQKSENEEIALLCENINNLEVHCSSDSEFKSECNIDDQFTKIEESTKNFEERDTITGLNMNNYDPPKKDSFPVEGCNRKLSDKRTKSVKEENTENYSSVSCSNLDSVQKIGRVEDYGNIDILNDQTFNYNECNDTCSNISATSNDSCVKEIKEGEEYMVNKGDSKDENDLKYHSDEAFDENDHELEGTSTQDLIPWEIKYIPPMRMFYRSKNAFVVHTFLQEEIGCYDAFPSLFEVGMYSEEKRRDLFYSFINFKNRINSSQGIEFIILCISVWIRLFGPRTNKNNILSVLVCVVMFYVIDGKIGRKRSKRSPEEVSSFVRKINNIKQSGKLCNLSSMSVDELIESLTKEECKLAGFYMNKFHNMDPNVNKRNYDRYIIHSFSEFQATVYFLQYLNSLLYFPFPVIGMDSIWSGTFCYNILGVLNHVNDINVLLGMIFTRNERIKMLYIKLYSLIEKLVKVPAVESVFCNEPTIAKEIKILRQELGIKKISAKKKKKKIKRKIVNLEEKIEYSNEEIPLLAENRFSALVIG